MRRHYEEAQIKAFRDAQMRKLNEAVMWQVLQWTLPPNFSQCKDIKCRIICCHHCGIKVKYNPGPGGRIGAGALHTISFKGLRAHLMAHASSGHWHWAYILTSEGLLESFWIVKSLHLLNEVAIMPSHTKNGIATPGPSLQDKTPCL